jgi:hypothetical protein
MVFYLGYRLQHPSIFILILSFNANSPLHIPLMFQRTVIGIKERKAGTECNPHRHADIIMIAFCTL